jgi:hypothetical protein
MNIYPCQCEKSNMIHIGILKENYISQLSMIISWGICIHLHMVALELQILSGKGKVERHTTIQYSKATLHWIQWSIPFQVDRQRKEDLVLESSLERVLYTYRDSYHVMDPLSSQKWSYNQEYCATTVPLQSKPATVKSRYDDEEYFSVDGFYGQSGANSLV